MNKITASYENGNYTLTIPAEFLGLIRGAVFEERWRLEKSASYLRHLGEHKAAAQKEKYAAEAARIHLQLEQAVRGCRYNPKRPRKPKPKATAKTANKRTTK